MRYAYQGLITPPAPSVITTASAGNLDTKVGTYYFWLQTRNRAGFSVFSAVTIATLSVADLVNITIPSTLIPSNSGIDVRQIVVLANTTNTPSTAVIVASVPYYSSDGVTPISLPLTIQLGEDHHLELGKQVDYYSELPSNPCAGQRVYVEQDDRVDPPVDFNTIVEYLPLATIPGWYPAFDQSFATYVSDIYSGALTSIGAIDNSKVITSLYALSSSASTRSPSQPVGLWLINDTDTAVSAGSRIGLTVSIGGDDVSPDFVGLIQCIFKGYVNINTGVTDTTDGDGGTMLLINDVVEFAGSTIEVLRLQKNLPPDYAVWLDIKCIASLEELNNRVPFGSKIKISPYFFTYSSRQVPPDMLGGAIFDTQNRRVIIPSTGLSATALRGSGRVQLENLGTAFNFWNAEVQTIAPLAANTANQSVVITKEGNCFALDDITNTTQLRALVGTVDGAGAIKGWSTPIALNGSQYLNVAITHPISIREDYPDDLIAAYIQSYTGYGFRVYIRKDGGAASYYDFAKGTGTSTTIAIGTVSGTTGEPETLTDPYYGLHEVDVVIPTAATGTTVLTAGNYEVAIAPLYSSNVSSINNSPSGGITTIRSSLATTADRSTYWQAAVLAPTDLRSFSSEVRPGMRVPIADSPDVYYWDTFNTDTDDGISTIAITGRAIGRFKRWIYSGFVLTTASFVQPAVNNTVNITMQSTSWLAVGSRIFYSNDPLFGHYKVTAIVDTVTVTAENLGFSGDSAVSTTMLSGGTIVVSEGKLSTIAIGSVSTLTPSSSATVFNVGSTNDAVFNFGIPKGDPGVAATVSVGTVTTLPSGSSATVSNSGTSLNSILDFGLPRGDTGAQGIQGVPGVAATVSVGTVTTLSPGSSATVSNSGTSSNTILDFGLPRGDTGAQGIQGDPGVAATVSVGTVTTLPPGSSATVSNSGTSSNSILDFGLPKGDTTASPGLTLDEWDSSGTFTNGVNFDGTTSKFLVPGTPSSTRTGGIPLERELIWDTDEKKVYIGDGVTAGGVLALNPGTVSVGTVTTLSPGSSATVTNAGTSSAAVFDFGLPQGATGAAATVSVGTVTTLPSGSSATVTNVGTSGAAVFDFGLPQGATGLAGSASAASELVLEERSSDSSTVANEIKIFNNTNALRWRLESNGATYTAAALEKANTWIGAQGAAEVTLVDAANILVDASLSNAFTVTLGGNRTLSNPTNLVAGFTYTFRIVQDAVGSRTLTYGSAYRFPNGVTPTLSISPNAVDYLTCFTDGSNLNCFLTAAFTMFFQAGGSQGYGIFGYGLYGSITYVNVTNLVSNTGGVASDTTGVGTARYALAAASYGGDKAIFGYGITTGSVSITNLVSNTGAVASDTTGIGSARYGLAAASYGGDKAIFGYGSTNSVRVSITNLVSNTGVVATDTTGVGIVRLRLAAASYGGDKAIFGYGEANAGNVSAINLVSSTGVVASDTTYIGTARYGLAAASYGGDKAIFGYGYVATGAVSITNLVSNTGVVATDTTGIGTARSTLAAASYGGDKAIFGYGYVATGAVSITNLVSNTGVVATDTAGAGTARRELAGASYG